jgi:hypothetical protein
MSVPVTNSPGKPRHALWFCVAALLLLALGAFAWWRSGLLDLPSISSGLTLEKTGLAGLDEMKQLSSQISSTNSGTKLDPGATLVQSGLALCRTGDISNGLDQVRQGVRLDPNNLVLANAYRMTVFALRRDFLVTARQQNSVIPQFPPQLDHQPIRFFEELDKQHPSRETRLHLALAWVDEMLLFPALEIKAPSSVQAVELLTGVVDKGESGYVPALYARGLNHLHRPSRLVWPESAKTPQDAAARDIGRCVAIGRRFNVGSSRLQATLALSLGDAFVKAGRLGVARSWWQIAQNLCREDEIQAAVHRRYGWQNEEILDRLEEELDRSRSSLDHPMTDLAFIWN